MSKVISFIKDPHVVIECPHTDNATLLCEYRILIDLGDNGVVLISTTAEEMQEGYTAEEFYSERAPLRKELEDVTEGCIIDSIKAWRNADRNTTGESPADTAKWVLRQFVKAGMIRIGDEIYSNVMKHFK